MGQTSSLPVLISPTGVQAVHPDGEVAVARAAAARGTAMGLSSFASKPVEEVVAANPQTFFQLYWAGSREQIVAARATARKAAGAVGLILTLDWSFSHGRDWGSPHDPGPARPQDDVPGSPRRCSRVRVALPLGADRAARRTSRCRTWPRPASPRRTFFGVYGEWMQTPLPTWEDLRWLREQWDGPLMLKGVMRVDDARQAVDAGFDAISVSNHGGNNLDGTPASIRALPAIADAVGDQIEVLLDGGIRRGSDVVKALALGARAVMIGRPYLWGLAANGQAGVENVLDVLRSGIDSALLGLGRGSVHELGAADLLVPASFERRLGVAEFAAERATRPARRAALPLALARGRAHARLRVGDGGAAGAATGDGRPAEPAAVDVLEDVAGVGARGEHAVEQWGHAHVGVDGRPPIV